MITCGLALEETWRIPALELPALGAMNHQLASEQKQAQVCRLELLGLWL